MADPATPPTPPAENRYQKLVASLFADKTDLGSKVRSKAKELFPDVQTPEDAAEPVVAPLRAQLEATQAEFKAYREGQDAKEAAATEASSKATFERAIEAARDKFNLRPEGYDKMLDRMKETNNYSDPEAAAAWVAQTTAPPPAKIGPAWQPQKMKLFEGDKADEDARLLWDDSEAFQDQEFGKFVADPDGFVRETFGGQ